MNNEIRLDWKHYFEILNKVAITVPNVKSIVKLSHWLRREMGIVTRKKS